jgi:hypothetical protein
VNVPGARRATAPSGVKHMRRTSKKVSCPDSGWSRGRGYDLIAVCYHKALAAEAGFIGRARTGLAALSPLGTGLPGSASLAQVRRSPHVRLRLAPPRERASTVIAARARPSGGVHSATKA